MLESRVNKGILSNENVGRKVYLSVEKKIEGNRTLYKGGMLLLHILMPTTVMNLIAIKVP